MTKFIKNSFVWLTISLTLASNCLGETLTLSQEEKRVIDDSRDPERVKACEDTLSACDNAVNKAKELMNAKSRIIEIRTQQVDELARQNAELQSERDSIWRSPLVWFLAGAVLGGLTYGLVTTQTH